MSSRIRVTSTELRRVANQLSQLNSQFKSSVTNLRSSEQSLAGMWSGDAQKAFRKAFNDNATKFDQFYQGIQEYIQRLEAAAKAYDDTEARNVSIAPTV